MYVWVAVAIAVIIVAVIVGATLLRKPTAPTPSGPIAATSHFIPLTSTSVPPRTTTTTNTSAPTTTSVMTSSVKTAP
jgi:hypothetical protein